MKLVITAATEKEVELIRQTLQQKRTNENAAISIEFHISGVGILSSCFSIAKLIFSKKPDLVLQVGIAGTFDNNIGPGNVVTIENEILADTGVEEYGRFKDLFDLNLQTQTFPFSGKRLQNNFLPTFNLLQLEAVTGITVNEITTRSERIAVLKAKYAPTLESMEGASLHYCCLMTSTPFMQIRAVSNFVGERDKAKWKFADAFHNLSAVVKSYIEKLETLKEQK